MIYLAWHPFPRNAVFSSAPPNVVQGPAAPPSSGGL